MSKLNPFKKLSIRGKIVLFSVLAIAITAGVISIASYKQSERALQKSIQKRLNNIAEMKVDRIASFFRNVKPNVRLASKYDPVRTSLPEMCRLVEERPDPRFDSLVTDIGDVLRPFRETYGFEDVLLVSKEGKVVYTTDNEGYTTVGAPFSDPDGKTLNEGKKGLYTSRIYERKGKFLMDISAPVQASDGELAGVIVCRGNMEPIYEVIQDATGMGETGETLIGDLRNGKAVFLNPLRHDPNAALQRKVRIGSGKALPVQRAVQGRKGQGFSTDYRGQEILATWRYIPEMDWGLVAKIDTAEAFAPVDRLQATIVWITLGVLVIVVLGAWAFSNIFSKPLMKLRDQLSELKLGKLPGKMKEADRKDEIGEMATASNELVEALGETAEFAERIGENELDADFQPLSEEDVLGNSLLKMRASLKEAQQEDEKRKEEDEKRNWANQGFAKFGDILREQDKDTHQLADKILRELVDYVGANQGGLFILNDEDRDDPYMELSATYAWGKKKHKEGTVRKGEGLIGQAWQERDKIYLTEVPEDFVDITSGLGEANPRSILIVPLKVNDEIHGMIELASFDEFEDYRIEFIEKLAETIASTLSTVKTNEVTRKLLEESNQQKEELQAQEEELRQNKEEMQATQEEMERKLKDMEETLNQEKLKGKSFEEASFPALVMDKKGTVKAANTELAKLLGYNKDDMPEKGAEDLVDAGELKLTQMGSGSVTLKASDGKEVPSEVEVADFELDGTEHYAAYFREKEEA